MDEFGLVRLNSVWFDEVDFLKCSCSASQLFLYLYAFGGFGIFRFVLTNCAMLSQAAPAYVRILAGPQRRVVTNRVSGPHLLGTELQLECEAGGGRPAPSLTWHVANTRYSLSTTSAGIVPITVQPERARELAGAQ